MHKVLLLIPAFNEAKNIEKLINKINLVNIPNVSIDTLVINDCSKDNTSSICKSLGVNLIDLPCNLGIGGAVQTGYKYAKVCKYDIAIQVDGDGQHDPSFIKDLIAPIVNRESDMVIGSRFINKVGFQSTFMRRVGIVYLSKLINILTGLRITDPTSGFRACNKKVINLFADNYPIDYPEPESILHINRKKLEIKEIPVLMREREAGISSINFFRSIYYMIKVSLSIVIDKFRKEVY